MNRLALALLAAAGLATALPAAAQFQKPEDAIKYRQSAFTVMASHFGRIAAMAQGKVPFDAAAAKANADIVATMSRLPFAAFPAGTDSGQTKAKAEIWSEPDKFRQGATTMQEAVGKLQTAANSGNLDQIKAAVGDVGKSCKACHDSYRKD
jgi:cytochrome c556